MMLPDLVYSIFVMICLGAALGVLLKPDVALRPIGGIIGVQLYGAFPIINPNEMGYIAAVVATLALVKFGDALAMSYRWLHLAILCLALTILVLSQARTSVVALSVALVVLAFLSSRKGLVIAVGFAALIGLAGEAWLGDSPSGAIEFSRDYMRRGLDDEQVRSFTGRTELWSAGWAMVMESPLIGHGFEAGTRVGGEAYGVAVGSHMHNSHLQVLANTGFIGYSLWGLMIAAVSYLMVKAVDKPQYPVSANVDRMRIGLLCVLIISLIRTFTGSVLVTHSYSMMLLASIMVSLAPVDARRWRSGQAGRPRFPGILR